MIKKLIIVLILFVSFNGVSQESSQNFSLQEAIDYALENNRAAKNAARDIQAAEKQNGKLQQLDFHKLMEILNNKIG